MNLREATLKAADQIEQHPETFDFMSCHLPDLSCGTPGCALGWIAIFAGIRPPKSELGDANTIGFIAAEMKVSQSEFYGRMDECCDMDTEWIDNPAVCAKGLRIYAERFLTDDGPK